LNKELLSLEHIVKLDLKALEGSVATSYQPGGVARISKHESEK
jgi:hypothetical protein